MLYTNEDNRTKLHLVMLSPDVEAETLLFYVNRPISTFAVNPTAFCDISRAVTDMQPGKFKAIAMDSYLAHPIDGCTLPDEDGMVLQLALMPSVDNLTEAIAQLAEALASVYRINLWETFISGSYGQEEPPSYNELCVWGMPAEYLHAQATMHMDGALVGRS